MKEAAKVLIKDMILQSRKHDNSTLKFCDADCLLLLNYITTLQRKEYNNSKAIEYIENKLIPYGDEWHWDEGGISYMVDDVLNILKGEENE